VLSAKVFFPPYIAFIIKFMYTFPKTDLPLFEQCGDLSWRSVGQGDPAAAMNDRLVNPPNCASMVEKIRCPVWYDPFVRR
jgi:hypothetical protein